MTTPQSRKPVRRAAPARKPIARPLYKNPAAPVERRIDDLLSRMTLKEKVYQMCGAAVVTWITKPPETVLLEDGKFNVQRAKKLIDRGIAGFSELARNYAPAEGVGIINDLQRHALTQTRLGIPLLIMDEALHGCCAKGATAFPQCPGLASTWDPSLLERIGATIGRESRSRGINQVLAPNLNLARDPRWGRTEETYGEDPHLVCRLGVAYIRGIQGTSLADPDSVVATLKHFAVHNAPEGGLNIAPTVAGERLIRDQLLRPFEAAVREAGAMSVMSAYSEIDGIPASANRHLLTEILRNEWGFTGTVVSDYGSVNMMHDRHHTATDKADAARQAVEAGVDIELPSIDCFRELIAMVEDGRFSVAYIDQAVRRVLRLKFLLGLFENPYADSGRATKANDAPAHRALALEAAEKSLVLLKNDGLLPVGPGVRSIAVIGPNADAARFGNYATSGTPAVTALQGLRQAAGGKCSVGYAKGCEIYAPSKEDFAQAIDLARQSDVAILVMGEVSDWGAKDPNPICGESYDQDSLNLAGVQLELVQEICKVQKNVVVVLYNGRPLSVPWIAENVPAILEAWYPGEEGGTALANILLGRINPSGRLPITIPATVGQVPVYYNHKPTARGFDHKPGTAQEPGRDYVFSAPKPLYAFGHGLSYTTFAYSNLTISPTRIGPCGTVTVTVDVTNTGTRRGDEVVQLYVRDCISSATRPVKELKGFQRIALRPGQKKRVTFKLGEQELAFYDRDMKFTVEPGAFEVMVGGNSVDQLKATFEVVASPRPTPV